MSFTPGPWEVHKYPNPNKRVKRPCFGISSHHVRDFIAQYVLTEANARAIAEVPKMVELLKKFYKLADESDCFFGWEGKDGDRRQAWEIVEETQAILSRIEGEEMKL